MGRNGGGGGDGGGKGNRASGAWTAQADYGQSGWAKQPGAGSRPGRWTETPHTQPGSWGQPSPGWPQHPQAPSWEPQAQAWGRPSSGWNQPTPYGKGGSGGGRSPQGNGPYSGQEPCGHRGSQGVWQGIQDVTAAARVALDAARELRSLGELALAPAPGQSPLTDSGGAGRSWLAAARGWLLGDLPDLQLPPLPHACGPAPQH